MEEWNTYGGFKKEVSSWFLIPEAYGEIREV
jgi:hypothetical protein